uniref:Uncharacterized protein n=1 Tax=Acrobeloides nanus TaxID=290746 RepID=A0A914CSL0_9BILA
MKIYRKLKATQHLLSPKTRQLQKQLNLSLISQATSPILSTTLPIIITVIMTVFKLKTDGFGMVVSTTISWMTVLNPLSTILFVSQYRRTIMSAFKVKTYNSVNPLNDSKIVNQNSRERNLPTIG